MPNIVYKIVTGNPPFTASLSPAVQADQIHDSLGTYSFVNIPIDRYTLTITDSEGCVYTKIIDFYPTTTTSTTVPETTTTTIPPTTTSTSTEVETTTTTLHVSTSTTTESTTTTTSTTTPPDSCYGILYNKFAIENASPITKTNARVPSRVEWMDLINSFGGLILSGGHFKEVGFGHWNPPNSLADNSSGLNLIPGGERNYANGIFNNLGQFGYYWGSDNYISTAPVIMVSYNNGETYYVSVNKKWGYSIRLIITIPDVDNGDGTGIYVGNDDTQYPVIYISSVGQWWLAKNLAETQYRDHSYIPLVENNASWITLSTGAITAYNNDWNYTCVIHPPTTTSSTSTSTTSTSTSTSSTTTSTSTTSTSTTSTTLEPTTSTSSTTEGETTSTTSTTQGETTSTTSTTIGETTSTTSTTMEETTSTTSTTQEETTSTTSTTQGETTSTSSTTIGETTSTTSTTLVSTTTTTNALTTTTTSTVVYGCNENIVYSNSGVTYPKEISVYVGPATGWVQIFYNSVAVPDKFVIEFDGTERINTGYRSSDYGEPTWGALIDGILNGCLDSIGQPHSNVVGKGIGTDWFYKDSATENVIVKVYAPCTNTYWEFRMSCVLDVEPTTTSTTTIALTTSTSTIPPTTSTTTTITSTTTTTVPTTTTTTTVPVTTTSTTIPVTTTTTTQTVLVPTYAERSLLYGECVPNATILITPTVIATSFFDPDKNYSSIEYIEFTSVIVGVGLIITYNGSNVVTGNKIYANGDPNTWTLGNLSLIRASVGANDIIGVVKFKIKMTGYLLSTEATLDILFSGCATTSTSTTTVVTTTTTTTPVISTTTSTNTTTSTTTSTTTCDCLIGDGSVESLTTTTTTTV